MSGKHKSDIYTDKDNSILQNSLKKSTSYMELISQIKSELTEKRDQILTDISTSYHIVVEKVEFERCRCEEWVRKEFDEKLLELSRVESELGGLRREVDELVDQDAQFNSARGKEGIGGNNSVEDKDSPSEDTFENQFLSLDSIHSLHSYLTKLSLREFDVPRYEFELDQLSLSALLTGRLVPGETIRFERDYSSLELPVRYLGVQAAQAMDSSVIQDVALDASGGVYALDRGNSQIHIFDADLKYKYSFGKEGSEVGEFKCPWSIVYCNHTKRVIISDSIQSTVQSFDLERQVVQRIKLGCLERYSQLGGICVDSKGIIFVVSCWENCIKVFSDKFKLLREFGNTELNAPKDLEVWGEEIIVLEAIQPHFRIFSATGSHLSDINSSTLLSNPWYFCIDTLTEQILVTEFSKHQVRVISKGGEILHTFGSDLFSFPAGISIDDNKRVFVCDSMHLRLAVF